MDLGLTDVLAVNKEIGSEWKADLPIVATSLSNKAQFPDRKTTVSFADLYRKSNQTLGLVEAIQT